MKKKLINPPAWFRFQSRKQEDVVQHEIDRVDELDRIHEEEMDKAREAALPMMAEVVRDLESRPQAAVTGGVRPLTQEVADRLRRNRRKNFLFRFLKFV
jgi:hypothetical protein